MEIGESFNKRVGVLWSEMKISESTHNPYPYIVLTDKLNVDEIECDTVPNLGLLRNGLGSTGLHLINLGLRFENKFLDMSLNLMQLWRTAIKTFGSVALSGKILLVRIVNNNKIFAYFMVG